MDKNTLTGLILIAILWVAMIAYNNNQKQKLLEEQGETTTTEQLENVPTESQQVEQEESVKQVVEETKSDPKNDSIQQAQINSSYGEFASFFNSDGSTYISENEDVIYTFNTKGGFLEKVELKKFKKYNQEPLILFDYTKHRGSFGFEFTANAANQSINTEELNFEVDETISDAGKEVTFSIPLGNGKKLSQVYMIPARGYLFNMDLVLDGFNEIIRPNAKYLNVHWDQTFPRQELSANDERINSTVYYRYTDGDVGNIKVRKEAIEKLKTDVNWISFKQKFFNSTMISKDNFENGKVSTENPSAAAEDSIIKYATAQMTIPFDGRSNSTVYNFQFYMGPNNYKRLKKLDLGLHNIVPLGKFIFGWVNKGLIIPVFSFLNKYIGNYGVIILILTLLIKLIITPFTYKSYMSMLKMKVLKPEIDELKEKHGKDQQKFGQAQMALFRKAGVNPLGGCLPMLFQMPILIAMYRFFPASIELRQAEFLWANDLSTYDSIYNLPFTIPGYGDHVSLFTILMAITSFFYTRMNSANTDTSGPMGAQMKMFQYFMPFMLLFIFNKFSAGLSYYYFLFNLLSVLQQFVMKKFFIDEDKIHAKIQENKKKPAKQSKFQARLEKMMKEQQNIQKQRNQGKKKK